MVRFLSLFALGGVVVPLIFQVIWWLVNRYQMTNLDLQIGIQKLVLILWPSSLMTLPAGSDESLLPVALLIAIAVNVVLYIVIGLAIWYGFKKHYLFFVLVAIVMVVMWWRILTL
ncbi:hypothetical protein OAS86_02295 [Gammaproteobacteria bacterium]|nr:hypothetical protein [Gammaproteobacteria bacterium]